MSAIFHSLFDSALYPLLPLKHLHLNILVLTLLQINNGLYIFRIVISNLLFTQEYSSFLKYIPKDVSIKHSKNNVSSTSTMIVLFFFLQWQFQIHNPHIHQISSNTSPTINICRIHHIWQGFPNICFYNLLDWHRGVD